MIALAAPMDRPAPPDPPRSAGDPMNIRVRGLGVRFGELQVIEAMSFSVRAGGFISLIGPSGCGKSTLLRVLAGLIPPSAGELSFDGGGARGARCNPGLVFQKPLLLPWRTTLANVLLPLELGHTATRVLPDDVPRARHLLDLVRLTGFEHAYPFQLSGGMQQRVALARALMSDPEILLLDEPFGALDELTRETLNEELLRIWRSAETRLKTIVMVTHSIPEAALLSDEILVFAPRPARLVETVRVVGPQPRSLESPGVAQAIHRVRELIRTAA